MTSEIQHGVAPLLSLRKAAQLRTLWMCSAGVLVLVLCAVSVALGTRDVELGDIVAALTGSTETVAEAAVSKRFPRTVLAVLVGASLAIAGMAMQAITRNPIAEPAILGISTGAAFAVVLAISFFGLTSGLWTSVVAILGATAAAAFVFFVGSLGRGGATPLRLTLAGAATSAAFISLTSAVMLPRVELLRTFQFWRVGSVGGATWEKISGILPVLFIGVLLCAICARGLNALAFGDELAAGLGAHVGRTRVLATVGTVALVGGATAVAGPIAFVGLVVPHVCRLLVGSDHRWLLPFSALGGAVLLLMADVLGRIVARPSDIEVGIVTALIGAPFFIWIVRRQRVAER